MSIESIETLPAVFPDAVNSDSPRSRKYLLAFAAVSCALIVAIIRISVGGDIFISDTALMMLALAAYLIAAAFYLTNIYAGSDILTRTATWVATLGVFFNLSSWLVRWAAAYDRELAVFQAQGLTSSDMPWVFRYIPFANLYDLSLAFAFGAGLTTLLLIRRKDLGLLCALSLSMAAIILVLARFIGSEFIDLPPVLDSYWRPIHVGIASLSYGVALVCFAVAIMYLIKDGLEVEKLAICTSGFAIAVFASVSGASVFALDTFGTYRISVLQSPSRMSLALRADVPYVGTFVIIAAIFLLLSIALFSIVAFKRDHRARSWGSRSLCAALVAQAATIVTLIYQIKTLTDVTASIDRIQFERFSVWLLDQQGVPVEQVDAMGRQQLYDLANTWVTQNAPQLHIGLNSNPVELAALITAFAGTLFIVILSLNAERIRSALPDLESLDRLMYRLGTLAFVGLALLLMTGAVWANESWGRYWGWDPKEVGALIAWLAYAGFLHSRIAYGWQGRRSAYFAIAAFVLVIFTYLGVSYLLPGLHSYA